MNIGDEVRVIDMESPFYEKTGVLENCISDSTSDNVCTCIVLINFRENRKVRQEFSEDALELI